MIYVIMQVCAALEIISGYRRCWGSESQAQNPLVFWPKLGVKMF